MTQEEIIRMARECGGIADDQTIVLYHKELERFSSLVAAREREKCFDAAMKAAEKAVDAAMLLEREACAKVCDTEDVHRGNWYAAAIRARNNKE